MAQDIEVRPEIAIFGAKEWILQQYSHFSKILIDDRDKSREMWQERQAPFFIKHLLPLIQSGSKAAIYLAVAFQPDYFKMTISQLTFFESSVDSIFTSVNRLRNRVTDTILMDLFRIRVLFECIRRRSKSLGPQNPQPYVQKPEGMKVEVRNLSFSYDN